MALYEKRNKMPSYLAEIPYGFKNQWAIEVSLYNLSNQTFNVSDVVSVNLNGYPVTVEQMLYLFDYERDTSSLTLTGAGSGIFVTLTKFNTDKTVLTFRTLVTQDFSVTGVTRVSGDMIDNTNPQNPIILHDTQKLDVSTYNSDKTALNTRLSSNESKIQNNTDDINTLKNNSVTAINVNNVPQPITNGTANISINAITQTDLDSALNTKVDKTVAGAGNTIVQSATDSFTAGTRTLNLNKTLLSLETGTKTNSNTNYALADLLGITALEAIDKELYYFTADSNISTVAGTSTIALSNLHRFNADGSTYVPTSTSNIHIIYGISTEYSGLNIPSRNYISSIGRVISATANTLTCIFTNLRLYNVYNKYNGYRGGTIVYDTVSSSLYYTLQRVNIPTSEANIIPLTNTLYYKSIKDDSLMPSDTVWGNFDSSANGGQAYTTDETRLKLLDIGQGYDNYVSFISDSIPTQILTDQHWDLNISIWVADGLQFTSRAALLTYLANFTTTDRYMISNNGIVRIHYEVGGITLFPIFTISEITNKLNISYQPILPTAVSGNIAVYDNSGVLVDSGKSSNSFATAVQGTKADSAVQDIVLSSGVTNGTIQINIDGTPQTASVQGLKSAAYTDSNDFATSIQGSKADSAVQMVELLPGSTNGAVKISANGIPQSDVHVTGLGSAAYSPTTNYATSAQGAKADTSVQSVEIISGNNNGTISFGVNNGTKTEIAVKGLGSAAYTPTTNYATSAQGAKADTALQDTDIVDNLTSMAADKPLSANQGRIIEQLIQSISPDGKPIGGFDTYANVYTNTSDFAADLQPININDTIYIAADENHTDMPTQYKVSAIDGSGNISYSFVRILPDSLRDFNFSPIQTNEIEDGSITSSKIQNESILTEDIAPNAITNDKLSNELQTSIIKANSSVQVPLSVTGAGSFIADITQNADNTLTITYTNSPLTQVQMQGTGDFVTDVNVNGDTILLNKNGTALSTIEITGTGNVITDANATAKKITLIKGEVIQNIVTNGTGNVITDISTAGVATKGTMLKSIAKSGTGNVISGVSVSGDTATLATTDAVTEITTSGSGDMVSNVTLSGKTLQIMKAAVPQTVGDASTSQKGIVQLNDTLTSTSVTESLTANQGKVLNDKITSNDTAYVKLSGNQTITGTKTFSSHPVVPSKTTLPVTPSAAQYATESQVNTRIAKPASSVQNNIAVWNGDNDLIDSGIVYTAISDIENDLSNTKQYVDDVKAIAETAQETADSAIDAIGNKQDKITANGVLKSNGTIVSAAVPGTDYATPTNVSTAVGNHNGDGNAHGAIVTRVTALELAVGDISTALDTILGEVI